MITRAFRPFFLTLLCLVAGSVAIPQPPERAGFDSEEFGRFVLERMKVDKIPGLSIGFIKEGELWATGYGYADLENRVPATEHSMYRLASITKPMTATAILKLAEEGKLDLDAEVQKYVPYFPRKEYSVTPRLLMGHLGGISHYQNYDLEGHFKTPKNTRESIKVFEDFELVAEPGTRFNYSSYGYNLLGAVIEGASGKSYAEYMRENVWGPLEMNDIRMDDPSELIPNRVSGYQLIGGKIYNSEFVDISSRFAAGGTRASVVDVLKFGKGTIEGKVLAKASLDLMFNSMITKNGTATDYSAGWTTIPRNGRFTLNHSGGQAETSTLLYCFPSRNLVIAITTNLEGASRIPYLSRMFEMLTGEKWDLEPYIADESKRALFEAIQEGFEVGRSHFEKTGSPAEGRTATTQAFAEFNRSFDTGEPDGVRAATMAKVAAENRRRAVLRSIGSYIADVLHRKKGRSALEGYSNTGSITFFADYIQEYRRDRSIPREFRFAGSIVREIGSWQKSWGNTNDPMLQQMVARPDVDFKSLAEKLREAFAGEEVYPNFAPFLIDTVRSTSLKRDSGKALAAGKLAVDLYPNISDTNALYGSLLVATGTKVTGESFLKRALEINPRGEASAGDLNGLAYYLKSLGLFDAGVRILESAIELHPEVANLYDSLGEFYLEKGDSAKALELYKAALKKDPGYPNAGKAAEIVRSLENP